MNRKLNLVLVMALGLTLTACAGKKDQGTGNQGSTVPTDQGTGAGLGSNAYGSGYSAEELMSRFGIEGDPRNYKIVYFEYNRSEIDERSRIIVGAHARHLAETGGTSVTLEGHADERGTRDYNLALGERRGQSVAQLMNAIGAGNSSIQTISYGEERPANSAHNESAWQENRRVQIGY